MLKDYYKILGVLDDAEDIVIKAAYRALAQRYHPDKWVGDPAEATRRMSEINMAYDVLSDQTKRKEYDQGRASNEYDESEDFTGGESEGDFGKSLDADWKEAVKYFPDLDGILGELSNISRPLAQTYKVYLLESKEFTKRKAIATQFELRFIKKYFGSNEEVVKFARFLIKLRARVAAKDLNRAVTLLGSDVDHKLIINRILKDYPDVASAYNPKPQKASQKTDFIDEFGKFLDPDARHGVWDYPKGHRPDSRTFSPIYLALGGLIVIVAVLIITLTESQKKLEISGDTEQKYLGSQPNYLASLEDAASASQLVTYAWGYMMPDAGTSPDYIKAYDLNRRAFEKDHAEGAANIGLLYENGWGANQDFELAASWYQKAIASKSSQSPQAQLGLARLHRLKLIKNASMATAKRLCKEALSIDYTGLGYPESPTSADHREINLCLNQVGFINR